MTESIEGRAADILENEADWLREEQARDHNFQAARAVAEAVRTTLGPQGMDKLIIDRDGMAMVTNDGRIVLNEMGIEDPMAEIIVAASTTQDDAAGDGTTTSAVLTGELLQRADELMEDGFHPMTIIRGFDQASRHVTDVIDEVARPVGQEDRDLLEQLAATTLTGRDAEFNEAQFAELVVDAALAARVETETGEYVVNTDNIKTEVAEGLPVEQSRLVRGAVIDKDPEHDDMPSEIENAKILLIDFGLRVEGPEERESDTNVTIRADQVADVRKEEEQIVRDLIERIDELGVDAVFVKDTINDFAQHYLARAEILGVRRIGEDDTEFLVDLLDATLLKDLDDFSPEHIGTGNIMRDVKDDYFLVEPTEETVGATILVRGETMYSADEYDRGLKDAIEVVAGALNDGRVLPGGGAIETELAQNLRDHADSLGSREAIPVEAFADALEVLPRTLARNAGMDPIDSLLDLRTAHHNGNANAALDVFERAIYDAYEAGIVDTARVKESAIGTAVETANIVLRVDDVISASPPEDDVLPPTPQEGGPASEEWGRDDSPEISTGEW